MECFVLKEEPPHCQTTMRHSSDPITLVHLHYVVYTLCRVPTHLLMTVEATEPTPRASCDLVTQTHAILEDTSCIAVHSRSRVGVSGKPFKLS